MSTLQELTRSVVICVLVAETILLLLHLRSQRRAGIGVAQCLIAYLVALVLALTALGLPRDLDKLLHCVESLHCLLTGLAKSLSSLLVAHATLVFLLNLVAAMLSYAGTVTRLLLVAGLGVYVRQADPVANLLTTCLYTVQKLLIATHALHEIAILAKLAPLLCILLIFLIPGRTRNVGIASAALIVALLVFTHLVSTYTNDAEELVNITSNISNVVLTLNTTYVQAERIGTTRDAYLVRKICVDTDSVIVSRGYVLFAPRGCIYTILPAETSSTYTVYHVCFPVSELRNWREDVLLVNTGFIEVTKDSQVLGYVRCLGCVETEQQGSDIVMILTNASLHVIAQELELHVPDNCTVRTREVVYCSPAFIELMRQTYEFFSELEQYTGINTVYDYLAEAYLNYSRYYKLYIIEVSCRSISEVVLRLGLPRGSLPMHRSLLHEDMYVVPYIEGVHIVLNTHARLLDQIRDLVQDLANRSTQITSAFYRAIITSTCSAVVTATLLGLVLGGGEGAVFAVHILRGVLYDLALVQLARLVRLRSGLRVLMPSLAYTTRRTRPRTEQFLHRALRSKLPSTALRELVVRGYRRGELSLTRYSELAYKLRGFVRLVVLDLLRNIATLRGVDRETIRPLLDRAQRLFRLGMRDVYDIVELSLLLRLTPLEIVSLSLDVVVLKHTIARLRRRLVRQYEQEFLRVLEDILARGPRPEMFEQYTYLLRRAVVRLMRSRQVVRTWDIVHEVKKCFYAWCPEEVRDLALTFLPVPLLRRVLYEYRKVLHSTVTERWKIRREIAKIETLLRLIR